jgi:RNA recognition motif-containing protein
MDLFRSQQIEKKGKNMGKMLYVTNISFVATEDDIRTMFSVAGTVRSIKLLADPQTGKFRGCGFVEMSSDAEAKEAVDSLDEVLMIDRLLTVVIARPSKPKESPAGEVQKARKRVFGPASGERSNTKERPSGGAGREVKRGSGFGASGSMEPKGRPSGSTQRAVKAGSSFGASAGAKAKGRPSVSGAAPEKPGRSNRPGKGRK